MTAILDAREKGMSVELIPQIETQGVFGGHSFVQPDYQGRISRFIEMDIIENYEIY